MKVLLALGLTFGVIFSFAGHAAKAKEREDNATAEQKTIGLSLSLAVDKRRYKTSDEMNLQVMLLNPSSKPVYVFRTLDWGLSASLSLHLRNASGKEIEPEFFPDAQTYESPDDKTAFVKLGPDHFLGANFPASIKFLNFTRPGKYSIFVEYTSPFSTAEVELQPFFGKENGTIKSNVVHIEVVR
jgi:hypothetical protein